MDQKTAGRAERAARRGLPALIAPAFAVGGAKAVELFLAAVAALRVVLAYLLALRVVPDPWALGAALAVGLCPRFWPTAPRSIRSSPAAAALAGAALLALRIHTRSRPGGAGCFVLLGALPWLGTKFVPGGARDRGLRRALDSGARRHPPGGARIELSLFRVALFVAINEALYDGPTPYAAEVPVRQRRTRRSRPATSAAYRLVALFLDRDYGLLRWAPIFPSPSWASGGCGTRGASGCRRRSRHPGDRAGRRPLRGGPRGAAARRGLPGADDVRLLVPAAAPARRAAARDPARGLGAPARAARGSALGPLTLGASVWLYADVRWGGGCRRRPAGCPVRPADGAFPCSTPTRLADCWRGRSGSALPPSSSARLAPCATRARRPARRARSTPGSARRSGRSSAGGSRSGPRPARSPRPRARASGPGRSCSRGGCARRRARGPRRRGSRSGRRSRRCP